MKKKVKKKSPTGIKLTKSEKAAIKDALYYLMDRGIAEGNPYKTAYKKML